MAARLRLLHRAAAAMAVLGLVASLMIWQMAWRRGVSDADARFEDSSQHIARMVEERMLRALDLVAGFRGMFTVGSTVTRLQFHEHAASLRLTERFPGVMSVQYAPLVLQGERVAFEDSVRADRSLDPNGYPDYAISPRGERPFYLPVLYNEPMASNEAAFGYDSAAEPTRRRSLELARDTGEAIATPPLQLLQGETGLVIRLAVYRSDAPVWIEAQRRAAFEGVINGVFRASEVLGPLLPEERSGYRLRIEDRGRSQEEGALHRLLFETGAPDIAGESEPQSGDRLERMIPIAGRQWAVILMRPATQPAFAPVPLAMLLGGCALTLTLWWLLHGLARHYENASSIATRMAHAAQHDSLTGLPNRMLLEQRVREALVEAQRTGDSMALLFIDLDRFKPVNDTLGHDAGDAVLRQVALRLCGAIRPSDTVARLGGDEFVVLLASLPQPRSWESVAARIERTLGQPMSYGSHRVMVGASLGVAVYPEHGEDAVTLLRHADEAMYGMKRARALVDKVPAA